MKDMVTVNALDTMVKDEFSCEVTLKEWDRIKADLGVTSFPEYVDDGKVIWLEECGFACTDDTELAYFLWRCGCNLDIEYDWNDGSESYVITIPVKEEQYLNNLNRADKWWKGVEG